MSTYKLRITKPITQEEFLDVVFESHDQDALVGLADWPYVVIEFDGDVELSNQVQELANN